LIAGTLEHPERFLRSWRSASRFQFLGKFRRQSAHDEIYFASSVAPEEDATYVLTASFAFPKLGENKRLPKCAYCR
jgi:hypothetical protein